MSGSRRRARQAAQRRNQRRVADMEKRRQTLRKRSAQAAAAADQGGHRRWLAVGCSVAAAALVIGGIVIIRSRGSSAADVTMVAAQVDGTVGPLDITESPAAYTVTYRVETFASDGGSALTTEDFSILRPFDTSIVSKSGAPPGGDEQWSVTTTTGLYQQSSAGQDPTANVFAPTTAPGDYRFDASLGDLVADGDFVMGERRTLLGRQCQVYRTGSPLESYTITAPTDTDHSDVCIDDAGLLLEELSVASGTVTVHQFATAIDLAADLTDDDFTVSAPTTAADDGGTDLDVIDATTPPVDGYWSFPTAPDGYTLLNRYVLRQSTTDPDTATSDGSDTSEPAATIVVESYVDVYVDGADIVVVHQGPTSVEPAVDTASAHDIETSNLGTAQVSSGVGGNVVSAALTNPADWFIEVSGTIHRADLVSIAEELTTD